MSTLLAEQPVILEKRQRAYPLEKRTKFSLMALSTDLNEEALCIAMQQTFGKKYNKSFLTSPSMEAFLITVFSNFNIHNEKTERRATYLQGLSQFFADAYLFLDYFLEEKDYLEKSTEKDAFNTIKTLRDRVGQKLVITEEILLKTPAEVENIVNELSRKSFSTTDESVMESLEKIQGAALKNKNKVWKLVFGEAA